MGEYCGRGDPYVTLTPSSVEYNNCYDRRLWDFGASAHLLLVGIEVDVSLYEVIDFVSGIFCCDLSGDDSRDLPVSKMEEK